MFILGNLLTALARVIDLIAGLYMFIVAGAIIISWVKPDPYNPIVRFLNSATEPLFRRVRKFLPSALYRTGIDWTPMIVIIILVFLQNLTSEILLDLGYRLRHGTPPAP